jgi:hypothetical protein
MPSLILLPPSDGKTVNDQTLVKGSFVSRSCSICFQRWLPLARRTRDVATHCDAYGRIRFASAMDPQSGGEMVCPSKCGEQKLRDH